MPDKIPKTLLFNDGEGAEPADFNLMQKMMHSFLLDGVIQGMARDVEFNGPLLMQLTHPWVIGNAAAPYATATTRESTNLAGVIYQRKGSGDPDGEEPEVLAYYVEDDEYGQVHAVASVNPRWDTVSVLLEQEGADAADQETRDFKDGTTGALSTTTPVKRNKVKATFTTTQGAEAPSPTLPAPPGGHVRLASFLVSPGMGAFDPLIDEIYDHRMPLGNQTFDCIPQNGILTPADWLTGNGPFATTTHATTLALFPLLSASAQMRVTQIEFNGAKTTGVAPDCEVVRVTLGDSTLGPALVTIDDAKAIFFPVIGGPLGWRVWTAAGELAAQPLWANGHSAGYAALRVMVYGTAGGGPPNLDKGSMLAVMTRQVDTGQQVVNLFRFNCAGGN